MKNKNENMIAFYTEMENGLIDELVIDLYEKTYYSNSDIDLRELWCKDKKQAREWHVDRANFDIIFELVETFCESGEFYYPEESYEERQIQSQKWEQEQRAKPVVSKEKIWQAINCEMEVNELHKLISYDFVYPKDDYYNFDLMMSIIHAFMNGKVSGEYFMSWCVLMMRCLFDAMNCRSKKLQEVYNDIADYLDGFAFLGSDISGEKKLVECNEFIAFLKYYNHQIVDIQNKRKTDFERNGVITYVSFAFSINDGKDCAYNVCIVDKEKNTINYMIVYNYVYDEEIDYTILSKTEFEDLTSQYVINYTLDSSMTIEYPKTKSK